MISYLAIFLTIFLFSTIEVFSKKLTGSVDPFLIAFLRFFLSGAVLVLIDIKKVKGVVLRDLLYMAGLGLLGITLALGSFHFSINGLDAATGAVIFSMNPLFSSLYAVLFLKESFTGKKVVGVVTGFLGVYIVCFGFNLMDFSNINNILFMLLAAFGFGIYIAAAKPLIRKYGTFFTTGAIFIFGSLPYLLFIRDFSITSPGTTLPILIYLSLVTTGLAYALYFYGLKRVPVIVGTSMFFIKPVLATLFAIFLLGENPALHFYIGVIIILSGMTLTMVRIKPVENRS